VGKKENVGGGGFRAETAMGNYLEPLHYQTLDKGKCPKEGKNNQKASAKSWEWPALKAFPQTTEGEGRPGERGKSDEDETIKETEFRKGGSLFGSMEKQGGKTMG